MARSMWRGAIQFGLVTIPVKLYLATESNAGLSFNLLHKPCLTRVNMKLYCPFHDEYIQRSDTVRGYEWSKGEYVVIEDEDFEKVPLKTVRSIEIEQFVEVDGSDDKLRFVKQAYYIEPEPIGRKAFYLLKTILADQAKSAICKVVLKDREHLAALNPYSKTMLMTTLYWPDEIRSLGELELPEEEFDFKPAERAMAEQLVAAMTGELDFEQYQDEYRTALLQVIEAKVSGKESVAVPEPEPTGKLIDLMAALEASVAAAKDSGAGKAAGEAKATGSKPAAKAASKAASGGRSSKGRSKGSAEDEEAVAAAAGESKPQRRRKTA